MKPSRTREAAGRRRGRASSAGAAPPDRTARIYFDYALTGILETDCGGRVRRANPAAASITGYDARTLVGSDILALASPAAAPRAARHLALLLEQGISQAELQMIRRDGGEIVVEMASIQVDDDHFVHVFDDVTRQRQMVAEVERARAAAEAADRAKSQFLANVSHELRTPLNGIIGLGQLVLLSSLDAEQRDYIEKMVGSGQTLLRLVNDLLDTAKIEAGRMEFEHQPFSLAALLDELAPLREQARLEKKLDVAFEVASGVPPQLVGDALRLGQCLRNLLSNAIKFTPSGRVELRVDATADDAAPRLRFCVADTGIGLEEEALARLFSPFTQAEASTARRFGGSGLGLFITRELARGMGGELEVQSVAGAGSRFTLTLPLQAAARGPAAKAAARQAAEVPQEFRGRRILVAEDDPVSRIVVARWLARAGIDTAVARDGGEALAALSSAAALPELVLMDVQMPGMDGLEATRRLRARGLGLPVIGLSAGASEAEQAACLDAGMNDFIAKPIDLDELWGCLTRWLQPAHTVSSDAADESVEARFLHDAGLLASARAVFRQSHGDDGARLLALLAGGGRAEALRLAHGLKGSAATLGLGGIATLAQKIESSIESGAPGSDSERLCRQLAEQLARALADFG